ncbi:Deoxyribonuclease-2-alpha [Trichinella sp. T6]|nr:Deoxyribonuclease-2-alpha [Trichinella sp. T6]
MACKQTLPASNTHRAILYKGPTQASGKVLLSTAPGNWADGVAPLTAAAGHSFAVSLTGVVADSPNIKFLAYNNVPPAVSKVQTKSNSKGVIIVSTAPGENEGRWIVHTVPGFPAAKTGYSWPAAETAKGHLLICMTIAETQINAIASSLIRAEPFVYYNDIPESETAGMGDFKKLAEGQTATLPPFTIKQSIKITAAAPIDVHIYSKSAKSRYGDCRVSQRNILLIKSPAQIDNHPTDIEADQSNWIVSEPGNIFCFMDKPYAKSQAAEPAMAVCIDKDTIFARFNAIAAQWNLNHASNWQECLNNGLKETMSLKIIFKIVPFYKKFYSFYTNKIFSVLPVNAKCKNNNAQQDADWAILYKGPAQNNDSPNDWANGAAPVTQNNGHSFAVALTNVVGPHNNVKFLAYNNVPPAVPNVKTKSNSKGVIIISTAQGENDGAWIVHTVPGFPAAKTGYSWPAAEIAKGHLLICMTIAETQINAVAASLIQIEPFVYYNDIPETETAGMPDFKKLAEGQIPTTPPFTTRRSIKTAAQAPVDIHIYSKSAKSKYEIYKKVIVQALKKSIKVWSRRDNKLKGGCRVYQRNIRLIKSPAQIGDHPTNIEADESNWIVSEPGNIFCFMNKPYSNLGLQFALTRMQFLLDLMLLLLKLKTVHHEKQYESPEQVELLIKLE